MPARLRHRIAIAEKYDRMASSYEELYRQEQLKKYATAGLEVKPGEVVLDCGCGTGLYSEIVPCGDSPIIGVDLSLKMLEEVRKRPARRRMQVLQADATHLPFISAAFGAVVSFTVADRQLIPQILNQAVRVLKDGGTLTISALKKSVSKSDLAHRLAAAGLQVLEVVDTDDVKDYVARCRKPRATERSPQGLCSSSPSPSGQPRPRRKDVTR